jgi:hypothetical protein
VEEFAALLSELTYISDHPKHQWKRREAALLLVSIFVEDIAMYMTRNMEQFNMLSMFCPQLLKADFKEYRKQFPSLVSCLIGRQLQACVAVCDSIQKWRPEAKEFFTNVLDMATTALAQE